MPQQQQQESALQLSLPARGYRLLKQLGIFVASGITAALTGGKTALCTAGRGIGTAAVAVGGLCRKVGKAVWLALLSPIKTTAAAVQTVRTACLTAKEQDEPAVKAGCRAFFAGAKRNSARLKSYLNHTAALAGILVFAAVSIGCSHLSFAVEVTCNGQVLGCVEDETVYQNAYLLLSERLEHTDVASLSLQTDFHVVLHQKSDLLSAAELTNSLLRASGGRVQQAVGVYLDNVFFAAAETQAIAEEIIADYTKSFQTDAEAELTLREELSFLSGYYLTEDILTPQQLTDRLTVAKSDGSAWVHVLQTAQVVYQEEIPFSVEETEDDTLNAGVRTTTQEGVNGITQLTAAVTTENGVEIGREVLSSETLQEPVSQLITVGTKQVIVETPQITESYEPSASAGSATYIWPVNGGYTSAHYGDGRNHKGEDIAAPAGTHIYASRSGTVIRASWYSGYGLCVMIDHGDGVVTLYGHASRLNVTVGQYVEQGDVIAFVGSTGDSSGNHCHFEIRVNGTCINPENYIGARSR